MKMRMMWRSKAPVDATAAARTPRERRGFALPMAILIIAFLTVTIAAAYTATSSELTTDMAQRQESKAYMVAQAGLESFMARRNENNFCTMCNASGGNSPPVTTYESTTVALPGGYAEVVAQRIRQATNARPALYLMRSRGVDTTSIAVTSSSRTVRGERTVAQIVYWNVNQVNVLSGWTSTSGLDKNGSSGTISGVDACGKKPAVAGVAVPDGDYGANANFTPAGNPPVQYLGNQAAANAAVKIDWQGVVNGNRIQPDYTFANAGLATGAWSAGPPNGIDWGSGTNLKYPVIRVNDNFTLPSAGGQGTLIVMGNLTMSGNNLWHGILLVGGQMTSNGNGTVTGATMSGLNTMFTPAQLAQAQTLNPTMSPALTTTPANATANGTKTFQYDSCEVSKAAGGLASYSIYPNAWMDNFVTY